MGLDIDMLRAKQLLCARNRELFRYIHILAAAVVTLVRQTLGVLVCKHGARRGKHRGADEVFRRNKLDIVPLAVKLRLDGISELRVIFLINSMFSLIISPTLFLMLPVYYIPNPIYLQYLKRFLPRERKKSK